MLPTLCKFIAKFVQHKHPRNFITFNIDYVSISALLILFPILILDSGGLVRITQESANASIEFASNLFNSFNMNNLYYVLNYMI